MLQGDISAYLIMPYGNGVVDLIFRGGNTNSMTFKEQLLYYQAMLFALKAHAGQVDKAGKSYFWHLLRVSMRCKTPKAKIVALLHDTLEDTATTFWELMERFGEEIAFEVRLLTQTQTVGRGNRQTYIEFISYSPIAREVKIADLTDNMNLSRLSTISLCDAQRQRTYSRELVYLLTRPEKS